MQSSLVIPKWENGDGGITAFGPRVLGAYGLGYKVPGSSVGPFYLQRLSPTKCTQISCRHLGSLKGIGFRVFIPPRAPPPTQQIMTSIGYQGSVPDIKPVLWICLP